MPEYVVEYGKAGPRAKAMNAIPLLSRLYWYTIEFGLIHTPEGLRVYGAGILSSKGETVTRVFRGRTNGTAVNEHSRGAGEERIRNRNRSRHERPSSARTGDDRTCAPRRAIQQVAGGQTAGPQS